MQSYPVRLQLRRTKGFRLQEVSFRTNGLLAVKVDRGNVFGNPFEIETLGRNGAIETFRRLILGEMSDDELGMHSEAVHWGGDAEHLRSIGQNIGSQIGVLRGKNLACWCRLDQACHADVLLELANPKPRSDSDQPQRMLDLEKENACLKRLVADLIFEKQALKNVAKGHL